MERKQNASLLFPQIREYFHQTRWIIVLTGLFTFLTHGSILFSQKFGIDTELFMDNAHVDYLGRPGLFWLEKLLGLEWFNLYYVQILTLFFIALTPIAFGLLFYLVNGKEHRANLALFMLCVSFIVSPFLVSQMYFLCQSVQIIFAYLLIAAALFLVEEARKKISCKWFPALGAVLLMIVIFGCYQVLVVAYITGAAAVFILCSLKEKLSLGEQFRWIALHAGCFLVGFAAYLVIANVFYQEGSSYLTSLIAWNNISVSEGLRRCVLAILNTLVTNPPYYSGGYGILSVFFVGIMIYRLISTQKAKKGSNILIALAGLFLIISPYFFILFMGGEILDRIQLVLPLSQGCMIYLTVIWFPPLKMQKKSRRIGVGIVEMAFVLLVLKDTTFQLKTCSRLYYTDEWIFQYDTRIAENVYLDLQQVIASNDLDASFDNYIFLGIPVVPYNHVSLVGDTMGRSFFHFGSELLMNPRPISFMRNIGYPVTAYLSEGEQNAYYAYFDKSLGAKVDAMPCYPVPGYIQYLSDDEIGLEYVVIKLGSSWRLEPEQP